MKKPVTGTRAVFVHVRRAMRCSKKSGDVRAYVAAVSALRALLRNWDVCEPVAHYAGQAEIVTRDPLPGDRGRRFVCYRWHGPYTSGRAFLRRTA